MLNILFRVEVKPSKRGDFIDFINRDAQFAKTKEEKTGTMRFDYFDDPKDGNAFFVYEAYRDKAAFEAHQGSELYEEWKSRVRPEIVTKFQPLFDETDCSLTRGDSNGERGELKSLNEEFVLLEQQRDEKAKAWFGNVLSDQLVFRRANGSVVGKGTFLNSLDEPNPFTSRKAEDVSVRLLGDRALVTLIIRTTKPDGTENRYRNIRCFVKENRVWKLEVWYNYEVSSS